MRKKGQEKEKGNAAECVRLHKKKLNDIDRSWVFWEEIIACWEIGRLRVAFGAVGIGFDGISRLGFVG
jgi:hypothetical protein